MIVFTKSDKKCAIKYISIAYYIKSSRVETGSNTSTVALRVVGGDEKGTSAWGYNSATVLLGDINTGPGTPDWG
jgi:hypothetical protein